MELKKHLLLSLFILTTIPMIGQSLSMSPGSISPSSVNLTTTNAGATLTNPLTDYENQALIYTWPWNGGVDAGIYVYSQSIPEGFTVKIDALDAVNGWIWWNMAQGYSNGQVTVGASQQCIVNSIGHCSTINRPINQNITITDFSKLHPGNYPIKIYFVLR